MHGRRVRVFISGRQVLTALVAAREAPGARPACLHRWHGPVGRIAGGHRRGDHRGRRAGASGGTSQSAYIAAGTAGDKTLEIVQRAKAIAPLRTGPDIVTVQITPGSGSDIVTVWLDGVQVLRQVVPTLTATALLAFTGSTGGRTDVHLIRDVAIAVAG